MLQLLSIVPARFYLPASVAFFKNKRGYLEPVDLLGNGGGVNLTFMNCFTTHDVDKLFRMRTPTKL